MFINFLLKLFDKRSIIKKYINLEFFTIRNLLGKINCIMFFYLKFFNSILNHDNNKKIINM